MNNQLILTSMEDSVFLNTPEKLSDTFEQIKGDACSPEDILTALARGIDKARKHFRTGTYSIPEFLLTIDAYREGVRLMKHHLFGEHRKEKTDENKPDIIMHS